jgi:hypothetical protein
VLYSPSFFNILQHFAPKMKAINFLRTFNPCLKIACFFFMFAIAFECRQTATSDKLFEAIAPSQSGITFSNQLTESATQSIATYEYFYNGAGVAAGDLDGDGLPILFYLPINFLFLLKC